jgi:hypothetical protein
VVEATVNATRSDVRVRVINVTGGLEKKFCGRVQQVIGIFGSNLIVEPPQNVFSKNDFSQGIFLGGVGYFSDSVMRKGWCGRTDIRL